MNQKYPRLAAHWSETPLVRILGPMQEFINQSQASGITLLGMTGLALLLANSPPQTIYQEILNTHVTLVAGPLVLDESVLHWINDGLMALFFFLVGLEIKREVLVGELATPRAAALPILAAVGGVMVPATIYLLLNWGGVGRHGWGVPMATDIAFALGCLALLGDRIPLGLKVFLTAVAIVDDLMAVLVIALFYSSGIHWTWLGAGASILFVLALINVVGIRHPLPYIGLGVLVWLAFFHSGVHATIAGVLVAFMIPARRRIDAPTFLDRASQILQHFERGSGTPGPQLAETQQSAVLELEEACEHVQAPLQKMEHALHGWVAWGIMPLFALANAGVALSTDSLNQASLPVLLGIVLGLTLGKPIGIVSASWLAVRFGIAALPYGVNWSHMLGVGILAGMGFTMSLFIASLAFTSPELLATAKLAILLASLLAGVMGLTFLSRIRQSDPSR
jgi:NhaA family Na+:H+ antiporter